MIRSALDIGRIRAQFPILQRTVNAKPLVYFDSGATSQKPDAVINAMNEYYRLRNANIHRGVHTLSQEITALYESARDTVRDHLNATNSREIIFTAGTTASVNMVADTFGKEIFPSGGSVVVSEMEHHSNILPWQKMVKEKKGKLLVIPVTERGEMDMNVYEQLLEKSPSFVAVTHVSNTLGTVNPLKEMIRMAHAKNIPVLVDGAQAVPHMKVDVRDLDADFYCFSAHKAYGPTGVGVLYGKEAWLEKLPNYQVGGGTIKTVSFERTEYAELPLRFEAGTPNIEGGIGMKAALDWMNGIGCMAIEAHEQELMEYATQQLEKLPGIRILGNAPQKAGVISLIMEGIHPYDAGMILDKLGIAVRTGHHCTQPLMSRFGIQGTVRISFGVYNTFSEVDALVEGLGKVQKMLS
ncbi:MAG: SufS family cysteine desulfurase [Bacteroidia bacterium]|nr:SufS family cysteine desulfurase [Bacteroidia bacterium]